MTSRPRRRDTATRLALYAALAAAAAAAVSPFAWMVSTSLRTLVEVIEAPFGLPLPPQWDNYPAVFEAIPFARAYVNTVAVTSARTVGVLVISSMAAYAFSRLRFPGRDALFALYLATMMVPSQVTMIPTFALMRLLDWRDTYQALIVPHLFSAFGTFLLRQFMLTLPVSLEEAAVMDGASPWAIFRRIIVPLSKPALATLAVFTFLGAWNDFMWPLIITDSPQLAVLSVALSYLQQLSHTDWPLLMAGAVMALGPVLAVYVAAQRTFVAGIALTGIKG
ncbi:MAG: carbohydrate ABC transporter permease [Anaerolineae bacterium]|nr:carbohydrate ABC transporter permease [Anaerolineae bacterium]